MQAGTRAEIGRRKRGRTRQALIEAAMRVFARLGPDAASIDEIIADAGVARGTFYNYFRTGDELLTAVASEASERLLTGMPAIRNLPDPADRLACSVRMFVRRAARDPVFGWVVVRIALVAAPLGPAMRAYLAADVDAGRRSGRFRVASAQAAYDVVLGTSLMGMRSVLRGEAGASHAEHVATSILLALNAPDAAVIARLPMGSRSLLARGGHAQGLRPRDT